MTRILHTIRSHRLMLVFVLAFSLSAVAFAQTPVPITIDTNELFTSANTWIETFLPIMAIGIGISIALAILSFIGVQIVKAFRGGRS